MNCECVQAVASLTASPCRGRSPGGRRAAGRPRPARAASSPRSPSRRSRRAAPSLPAALRRRHPRARPRPARTRRARRPATATAGRGCRRPGTGRRPASPRSRRGCSGARLPARRRHSELAVDHRQRRADAGVVGGLDAEAHELEEARVDDAPLVDRGAAVADRVRRARVGVAVLREAQVVGLGGERPVARPRSFRAVGSRSAASESKTLAGCISGRILRATQDYSRQLNPLYRAQSRSAHPVCPGCGPGGRGVSLGVGLAPALRRGPFRGQIEHKCEQLRLA